MASAQAESSRHEVIPPTIRLQLWCYTELGRTSSANRALATFLTAAGVDDWLITATRPSGTPESSKDRFIPIEADLKFHPATVTDYDYEAYESLPILFWRVLPPLIRNFSKERGLSPLHITMFAVGDKLSRDCRQMYSFAVVLHSMAMHFTRVAHASIAQRNRAEHIGLSIVSNEEPETAVGGTDLSVQLQNVIRNFMRGESAEDGWLRIKTIFSEMNLPNDTTRRWEELVKQNSGADLRATREMTETWNKVLVSFYCFRMVIGVTKAYAGKISKALAIGDQDIYAAVIGMTIAWKSLSWHRREWAIYADLVYEEFSHTEGALWNRAQNTIMATVIGLALTAVLPFVETAVLTASASRLISAMAVSTAGLAFTLDARKAFNMKSKKDEITRAGTLCKMLDPTLNSDLLDSTLANAHTSIAFVFCWQVLRTPLEQMSRTEHKRLLGALGVDLNATGGEYWSRDVVFQRIEDFCTLFEKFETKMASSGLGDAEHVGDEVDG